MARVAHYDFPPSEPPASEPELPRSSADTWPVPEVTEASLRAAVVAAQLELLGPPPVRGQSPECDGIFADAAPCYNSAGASRSGKHWCGIACLRALRAAGLTDAHWKDSLGFIGDVIGWRTTKDPQPGDVFYTDAHQHQAIVERVEVRGGVTLVHTIDGNTGPSPGVVSRRCRRLGQKRTHYYPIAGLISARLAAEPVRSVLP